MASRKLESIRKSKKESSKKKSSSRKKSSSASPIKIRIPSYRAVEESPFLSTAYRMGLVTVKEKERKEKKIQGDSDGRRRSSSAKIDVPPLDQNPEPTHPEQLPVPAPAEKPPIDEAVVGKHPCLASAMLARHTAGKSRPAVPTVTGTADHAAFPDEAKSVLEIDATLANERVLNAGLSREVVKHRHEKKAELDIVKSGRSATAISKRRFLMDHGFAVAEEGEEEEEEEDSKDLEEVLRLLRFEIRDNRVERLRPED